MKPHILMTGLLLSAGITSQGFAVEKNCKIFENDIAKLTEQLSKESNEDAKQQLIATFLSQKPMAAECVQTSTEIMASLSGMNTIEPAAGPEDVAEPEITPLPETENPNQLNEQEPTPPADEEIKVPVEEEPGVDEPPVDEEPIDDLPPEEPIDDLPPEEPIDDMPPVEDVIDLTPMFPVTPIGPGAPIGPGGPF